MLANSSLLYKHSAIMENLEWVRKRGYLLFWFFEIRGLQFGIVREVCCRLVLWFGDLLSLGVLQLLDLICGSLFGSCTIRIWYLVFVVGICKPLVLRFVFVRECYLDVFEIWVCESASTSRGACAMCG